MVVTDTGWTLDCADTFARKHKVDGSEAYVSAFDVIVITEPFTLGEISVLAWVAAQDATRLVELASLPDRRDVWLLRRLHCLQSVDDAIKEQSEHLKDVLRLS